MTGWMLPRLSEFNAINKCKEILWSNSLKLPKTQMNTYKKIEDSFLIKELERKGKEQKRKLSQLTGDREPFPDAHH